MKTHQLIDLLNALETEDYDLEANDIDRVKSFQDERGCSVLYLAVENNFRSAFGKLIQFTMSDFPEESTGQTALMLALRKGWNEESSQLLATTDFRMLDRERNTVLHYAASGGDKTIIETLIDQGLDPKSKNRYGVTPFQTAIDFKNIPALDIFVRKERDEKELLKGLHQSIQAGMAEILPSFAGKIDLNSSLEDGIPPILRALLHHKEDVFFRLSELGASLSKTDGFGNTALHYAIALGFPDIEKFLVERAPELKAVKNEDGKTPAELYPD